MLPPCPPPARGHPRSERSPQRDGRPAPSPTLANDRNDPQPNGIRTYGFDLLQSRPLSGLDELRPHIVRRALAMVRLENQPPKSLPAARAPRAATRPPRRRATS